MAEIDPVILQLKAQDAEYKASLKDVIRLNDQVSGAILVAANKIDAAADRMIAAFQQMATSDKAAATAPNGLRQWQAQPSFCGTCCRHKK